MKQASCFFTEQVRTGSSLLLLRAPRLLNPALMSSVLQNHTSNGNSVDWNVEKASEWKFGGSNLSTGFYVYMYVYLFSQQA